MLYPVQDTSSEFLVTTFEKAKNHLEHLRTNENYQETHWLSEKPLTDLFDSIKHVNANYNFSVDEIKQINFDINRKP